MEGLDTLLGRHKIPEEPEEFRAIKRYVAERYNGVSVGVGLQNNAITITVNSAALANTLRLQTPKIQAAAQTDKRLVFRIG
jgi:hypothetical protein